MEKKMDELCLEIKSEIQEIRTVTKEIKTVLKEMEAEIFELKSEMKKGFETLHKRLDRFEEQMLNGFREMKLYVDNRNKEIY